MKYRSNKGIIEFNLKDVPEGTTLGDYVTSLEKKPGYVARAARTALAIGAAGVYLASAAGLITIPGCGRDTDPKPPSAVKPAAYQTVPAPEKTLTIDELTEQTEQATGQQPHEVTPSSDPKTFPKKPWGAFGPPSPYKTEKNTEYPTNPPSTSTSGLEVRIVPREEIDQRIAELRKRIERAQDRGHGDKSAEDELAKIRDGNYEFIAELRRAKDSSSGSDDPDGDDPDGDDHDKKLIESLDSQLAEIFGTNDPEKGTGYNKIGLEQIEEALPLLRELGDVYARLGDLENTMAIYATVDNYTEIAAFCYFTDFTNFGLGVMPQTRLDPGKLQKFLEENHGYLATLEAQIKDLAESKEEKSKVKKWFEDFFKGFFVDVPVGFVNSIPILELIVPDNPETQWFPDSVDDSILEKILKSFPNTGARIVKGPVYTVQDVVEMFRGDGGAAGRTAARVALIWLVYELTHGDGGGDDGGSSPSGSTPPGSTPAGGTPLPGGNPPFVPVITPGGNPPFVPLGAP